MSSEISNLDPFEIRLQETATESISAPVEQITEQQVQKDPFEARLEQKDSQSNSLWSGFMDLAFSEDETAFDQGLGQAIRGIGPSLAGIPGDVLQLIKGGAEGLSNILPDAFKKDPSQLKKNIRETLLKTPTSQDLQEKFDSLTDDNFQPKSRGEAFAQELSGDLAALMLPAGSAKGIMKAAGIATGANLAKEGMAELGFGDKVQAGTKIATMMGLSLFNPGGVKKYASNLYKKAFNELPPGAEVVSSKFKKSLINLEKDLSKGIKSVESKKPVLDSLREIETNIKDGKVSILDLTEAKRNLNEVRQAKIFDPEFKGTKKVRADLKRNFSKLSKTLDDTILEYGQINPKFAELYKDAQLAWGGIEQSKTASRFLQRHFDKFKYKSALGGLALGKFPIPTAGTTVGAAAGITGLKGFEMMHRIFKNPVLRKHYMNALVESTKENIPGVLNNIKKFDNEALKQEKKSQ